MAKRRQGSFGFLWQEMADTLFGRPTTKWPDGGGSEYVRYADADLAGGLTSKDGSDNLPVMAKSVEHHRHGKIRGEWMAWFKESWRAWMGDEVDSTTYDGGHVCAVLLVCDKAAKSGDEALYDEALCWLEYFGARALARWSKRAHRVLSAGQRSAGHTGPRFFADDFLDIAKGAIPPEKWKDGGHDKPFLWALRDLIRASFVKFTGAGAIDPVGYLLTCGRTTRNLLHILETELGMAVWHDPANINTATQPVPAAIEIAGRVEYLPKDRADNNPRIRAPGNCTVVRTPTSLVYVSEVWGRQEAALPGGRIIRDVVVGGPAAQPPVVVPGPAQPPPPHPPAPTGGSKLENLGTARPGEHLWGSRSPQTTLREIHGEPGWPKRWIEEEKP